MDPNVGREEDGSGEGEREEEQSNEEERMEQDEEIGQNERTFSFFVPEEDLKAVQELELVSERETNHEFRN